MPRNKSITSIDNRIKKVQEDLFKTMDFFEINVEKISNFR